MSVLWNLEGKENELSKEWKKVMLHHQKVFQSSFKCTDYLLISACNVFQRWNDL